MSRSVQFRRGWTRRWVLPVTAFTTMAVVFGVTPASSAKVEAQRTKLFVRYATKSACVVVPNYPKDGVVGNSTRYWIIPQGQTVIWRYNVDSTWALVSDPARADQRQFAWWGFTRRSCIGNSIRQSDYPAGRPVPSRILEGRSRVASSGWRKVRFTQPPAGIVARRVTVRDNGTLRDPANFVTGNVYAGWRVHVTRVTRGNGHWVYVYVPNAKRWGYIEARKLRG